MIFDNNGQVALASPDANRLFDYQNGELGGLFLQNILVDGTSITKDYQQKLQSGGVQSDLWTDGWGLNKSGKKFRIRIHLSHFLGGDEMFMVAFVCGGVGQSIPNEEFETENSSPVILVILDKRACILLINTYGAQFLGFSKEALKGISWLDDFIPVDERNQLQTSLEQTLTTGLREDYKSPLLSLTSEVNIFLWSTYAIPNSMGVPIGTLNIGIITEEIKIAGNLEEHANRIDKLNGQLELNVNKQHSEFGALLTSLENANRDLQQQIVKRKETEQKLMMFQRLYDTMIHNFPDGVIGVLNKKMEYILIDGKELNEIDLPALGLNGREADGDDPVLAQETINRIKKAFEGEHVSFEVNTKDRSYNVTAVPLHDSDNQINEILCVLKNVTEKNRIESVLLKALEKEKQLGELKSRFVTMACHEFKTPLATILSSTFLLENYSGEEYDNEKLLHSNRIRRSVNNLNTILNEFLLIEPQNGSAVKLTPAIIHIPTYISEVLLEVEPLRKQGQVVNYLHSGTQETMETDQHLLWSIVTNLIGNALKYSRQGGQILVTTEATDSQLTIKVKDKGIGIPPEEHTYIFERFHRAPNALNYEGTGLGLHIVRKNVKLLGGSVSFTSEVEQGTEFTVILPIVKRMVAID